MGARGDSIFVTKWPNGSKAYCEVRDATQGLLGTRVACFYAASVRDAGGYTVKVGVALVSKGASLIHSGDDSEAQLEALFDVNFTFNDGSVSVVDVDARFVNGDRAEFDGVMESNEFELEGKLYKVFLVAVRRDPNDNTDLQIPIDVVPMD